MIAVLTWKASVWFVVHFGIRFAFLLNPNVKKKPRFKVKINPSVKATIFINKLHYRNRLPTGLDLIYFTRYKFEQQIRMTRNMSFPYNKSLETLRTEEKKKYPETNRKFISRDKEERTES